MGYKSRVKQQRRTTDVNRSVIAADVITTIPNLRAKIIDDKSRRSWILISVSVPQWQISFTDWFHIFCEDNEHIQLDYGFSLTVRGTATSAQLMLLMKELTEIALRSYLYIAPTISGNGILVDRYCELDLKSYYT